MTAPHPFDISKLYHGQFAAPGLTLFAELGVAQRWLAGETVDVPAFCDAEKLDAGILMPYAKYFMWYGYLDETKPGCFAITDKGRPVFNDWPNAMMHFAYVPLLNDIFALARREKTYGYDKDVYRYSYFDGKGAGTVGAKQNFPAIVEYMRKSEMRCVMDIGCGDGTFLALACKSFPGLTAVGIDQSAVAVEQAAKTFAREGLSDRGQFIVGDIMRPDELVSDPRVKNVDLASLSFVFHELTYDGPELVLGFLALWAKSFPKVQLAVTEFYRQPDEAMKNMVSLPEHILRHDLSKQKPLHRDEWLQIYERAKFRVVESVFVQKFAHITKETMILEAIT